MKHFYREKMRLAEIKKEKTINNEKTNNCYYNYLYSNKDVNIENHMKRNEVEVNGFDVIYFKSIIKDKTISLVANSSDLLSKKMGKLIDANDIVIRFNSYNIHEEDTGTKTTIHASIYLEDENLDKYVPIRIIITKSIEFWLKTVKNLNKFKQGDVLLFNHFDRMVDNGIIKQNPPTSGFVVLFLLLLLGGFSKIELFGFTFYDKGVEGIFRTLRGGRFEISKEHNYSIEKDFIEKASYEYDAKNNIYRISKVK